MSVSSSDTESSLEPPSTDYDFETENEVHLVASSSGGSGPSQSKKARIDGQSKGTGRFKKSWNLPKFITASTKGNRFAYCKLLVSHCGLPL